MANNKLEIRTVMIINPFYISLLSFFVLWPLIYVCIFATQPSFILGDTENFILNGPSNGSSTPIVTDNGNLTNTLLTDKGRQTILWVSVLTAFIASIVLYFFISFR